MTAAKSAPSESSSATFSDPSAESRTPKPSRRPRNSLSPEAIVQAALAVSDRDGGALTFQTIGEELGAHPTALYRHFRDKDDLMLGLVDALHAEILSELGPPDPDWRRELRRLSLTMRTVFLRHPAVAQYAAVRTARREHEYQSVERMISALLSAGLNKADAARYYRVIGDAALSYSAMDAALLALDPAVREADLRAWNVEYQTLPRERFPSINAVAAQLPALDDPANFELLVDMLIAAVAAKAAAGAP